MRAGNKHLATMDLRRFSRCGTAPASGLLISGCLYPNQGMHMTIENFGAARRGAPLVVRARSADGMSLVEATIILMIIFLLTAVLSPTISDYVNDARQTKVKEDVEAIGTSVLRLLRDTGLPFPVLDPQAAPANLRLAANRVDLMVSDGLTPTSTNLGVSGSNVAASYFIANGVDWDDADGAADQIANMNLHLAYNTIDANGLTSQYPLVAFPAAGGPRVGLGWRGAYLTGPIGPDPWGNRYSANTVFLNPASDATGATGTNFDAFVLSAGGDGVVSTDMEGNGAASGGTTANGDDIIYVMTGNTR
jgi:type II secretory pathway pseudopilin PulG